MSVVAHPRLSPPRVPADFPTPAVVIDHAALQRNIERMAEMMRERGINLRPHAKTHKSGRIAQLQIEAGACGITVGTLGEAEVMVDAGLKDIFVAYPIWADGTSRRRLQDVHASVRLTVGVDSPEGARMLAASTRDSDRPLEVLVEIDSGERRTGTAGPEQTLLVAEAARAAGLRVRGVFTHGGHGYRPGQASAAAADEVSKLAAAADLLRKAGFAPDVRSAGSTPTAVLSATGPITEERPGTYVFGDRQQLTLGAVPSDGIALWVITTVVSTAVPGQFVIDAGSKTLAKDRPEFLEGYGLIPELEGAVIERTFDYHGVVRLPPQSAVPQLGQRLAIIPNHVCPVANLADTYHVVRDGMVIAKWPVDARCRNG